MIVILITFTLVGAMLATFGYLIYFRGKYGLINNFYEDRQRGLFNDAYARGVGLVEFIAGIVTTLSGIAAMIVGWSLYWLPALGCLLSVTALIALSQTARQIREPKKKRK